MRVAALAIEAVTAHREPRLQLDSVALSLTNDGYGKRGLWPAAVRARLANLALREAGLERAVVDEWEIQQDGFQQTHQVAQHFQQTFRDAGEDKMLLLLAGADLVEGIFAQEVTPSIPKPWTAESVGKLLSHIDGFIVIARRGSKPWTPDSVRGCLRGKLAGTEFAARAGDMVVIMAPSDAGGGSSTQVRKLLGEGLQTEEAKQQLADLVGVAVQEDILHNIDFVRSLS